MSPHPKVPRSPRGSTLLEAMIALSILLVGLLGMAQLQIWSLGANQGARAQTQALEIAKELAAGIGRLPYDATQLAPNITSPTLVGSFGKVIQPDGTFDTADFTTWDDADAAVLPNVRLDATFDKDAVDPALPSFQRRWSVWAPPGLASQYVRIIAVSVVYREKSFQRPMEVTLLTQVSDEGAAIANLGAFR